MILLTPRVLNLSTSACTAGMTSSAMTLRGLEMVGSNSVVAPTMPNLSPPSLTMALRTTRSRRTNRSKAGSPEKSRFELTNGVLESKLFTKLAKISGPKSNSWLPIAMASYSISSMAMAS